MNALLEKYKGIHPGLILERELKKRDLSKRSFALSLNEYPQIINEITKGRRGITAQLSLKIDSLLKLEEGTMYLLQAYHELQNVMNGPMPDKSIYRKTLFWDTDFDKLDWRKNYKAIIQRVFERGNTEEREETLRFYGDEKVKEVLAINGSANKEVLIMQNARIK